MSKIIKRIIAVLLVVLGALGSLYFSNKDYFDNKKNNLPNSYTVMPEDVVFQNWNKQADGSYISEHDGNIVIKVPSHEVLEVVIKGNMDTAGISPVIYFTNSSNEEFSEQKQISPKLIENNGDYIFDIEYSDLDKIRIDITDDPGFKITIESITIVCNKFQIGWLSLLMTAIVALFIGAILQIPLSTYKEIPMYLGGLKKYTFLLQNLVKKDIVTKYRRSTLGVLWSVLNPLLMMLVITAVFQNIFRNNIENFPIYYLTGSLIFNFNSEATTATMGSMLEAGPLIKKVYIPKYIFPLEKCFFALVNLFFSLIAVVFIYLVLQFKPPITVLLAPIPILYVFLFSLGFGMILSTLNVFFRDVSHLYSVWITAWMYLTPIIYPADILPPLMMQIMRLNPLYYYVEYFRNIMMYGIIPDLRFNLICIFFSVSFLAAGVLIFKKYQDKFILYI